MRSLDRFGRCCFEMCLQ
uniref:Uncharacterized protein n=1 Tax=Zea mays TaxID=4577 RepID=C4J7T6_MAIZE|nr:unknown [Zea mays]